MAESIRVVGIDPGPTTGIAVLRWRDTGARPEFEAIDTVLQCDANSAPTLLDHLLRRYDLTDRGPVSMAIEKFVISRHAKASATAGAVTRDLVGALIQVARSADVPVHQRSAAEVKPWANDRRLATCGLLEPTKAMPHARDAARHALFSACGVLGVPDPLSKRAR